MGVAANVAPRGHGVSDRQLDPATFMRTPYLSVPASWRSFTLSQRAARIEQALNAHHRIRWATSRTIDVDERIIVFALDFEWVNRADLPAIPNARSDSWRFPCAKYNPVFIEIARGQIDANLQPVRLAIDARRYADEFEGFRFDEDNSWHIIDWSERAAMFSAARCHDDRRVRSTCHAVESVVEREATADASASDVYRLLGALAPVRAGAGQ